MKPEEIRAYGRVYGMLAGIQSLTDIEIERVCFTPSESMKKAIEIRASKMTPEDHEKISEILKDVSPEGGRLTEEETGIFWLAFYKQVGAGRPPKYTEAMVTKSLRLPSSLWEKAAEKAAEKGKSVSEVIRDGLEQYVK